MKKLLLAFLAVVFLISCAGMTPQVQSVLEQTAARRLAYTLAAKDQSIIDPGIVICDAIIQATSDQVAATATDYAIKELTKYVGNDPLMAADLATLLSLVNVPKTGIINISLINSPQLKMAAASFKQGLELARKL